MLQGMLITDTHMHQRTVNRSGIVAIFTNHDDINYDVEITINGIKFLCSYSLWELGFQSFEVISSKGISHLSKKLILLLKETTFHLSYRI